MNTEIFPVERTREPLKTWFASLGVTCVTRVDGRHPSWRGAHGRPGPIDALVPEVEQALRLTAGVSEAYLIDDYVLSVGVDFALDGPDGELPASAPDVHAGVNAICIVPAAPGGRILGWSRLRGWEELGRTPG